MSNKQQLQNIGFLTAHIVFIPKKPKVLEHKENLQSQSIEIAGFLVLAFPTDLDTAMYLSASVL